MKNRKSKVANLFDLDQGLARWNCFNGQHKTKTRRSAEQRPRGDSPRRHTMKVHAYGSNDSSPKMHWMLLVTAVFLAIGSPASASSIPVLQDGGGLSPSALALTKDGRTLFIAYATAGQVAQLDTASGKVSRTISVPSSPLGLTLSNDERQLIVTCAAPQSTVLVIDTASGSIGRRIPAGHTAMAPVLTPDNSALYVCNRFHNEVVRIDLASGNVNCRIRVPREPVAAALTHDGKMLLVANHLHAGRSDLDVVASSVSVIDTAAGVVLKEIALPNGSGLLRDVRISPDGKQACLTHLLSRFHLPTTQIERGWINNNALTLIDLERLERVNTVLLDNIDSGAANPWGAAWSGDGKFIVVTHGGTHEVSIVNVPALLEKLSKIPAKLTPDAKIDYTRASRTAADVPNDLSFLVGLRMRVKLPEWDRGPRAVALAGTTAYVANYFSDSLSVINVSAERPKAASIPLGTRADMTLVRKGEFYFNDGGICFQGWQSCASCHSSDARVDGLNWDNLNDGIGNPKNVRSLLLAHQTPPSMALGVRTDAYASVRAGIKHSLFTVQPEEVPNSIDEYLKSLKPIPSPYLVNGKAGPGAKRGEQLFLSESVGCSDCHKPPLFTNLKMYDVGTRSRFDKPADKFDTPTLVEVWRSGPYLHDGSAATLRDVLTARNVKSKHGNVDGLSTGQIDDLVAYLLSL